jgi:hypothetical protein
MIRYLRSFLMGAVFALGTLSIAAGYAAVLPLFTAPGGSNAAVNPGNLADLNALVSAINSNLSIPASMTNVANGSVATAMSSLGPTGSHTTIQEWFAITTPQGNVRYVPGF